jgi:pimeloyl-ACP methyl ester carboxylesterase
MTKSKVQAADDLRGASQLAIDATTGITDLVEAMHRNIARVPILTSSREDGRTRGITGFVYRTVRGVTQVVGGGIDAALALASPVLGNFTDLPARDAVQSALNGVLGDHLVATNNPLAIPMQFRQNGRALTLTKETLASEIPSASSKVVVLIHGLCMNDQQWNMARADGTLHDHGAALQSDLGVTSIYLRYNTGQHVSTNGHQLAALLDDLIAAWPVKVAELAIVAHSMGGLVTRSACYYASEAKHGWLKKLKKIAFLGTPHQGAPLERGGHWIDLILGATPYASPFAKLGKVRSTGITDLRYGSVLDADWQTASDDASRSARHALPLPKKVDCLAVAASTGLESGDLSDRLLGDGLVPLASALAQSDDPQLALHFPADRQVILYATNHMQLLSSAATYEALRVFLAK